MVLGYGYHFVSDAKVADQLQKSATGDKSIIFARVTCGGTATRDLLGVSVCHFLQLSVPFPCFARCVNTRVSLRITRDAVMS